VRYTHENGILEFMGAIFQVILYASLLGLLTYLGVVWYASSQQRKAIHNSDERGEYLDGINNNKKRKDIKHKKKMILLACLFGIVGFIMYKHIKNRKK